MATALPSQTAQVVLTIMDSHTPPRPALVDGIPVWASSDETVLRISPATDGMSAIFEAVAIGTARATVTADADLDPGVTSTITDISEDIVVSADIRNVAAAMNLAVAPFVDVP